MRATRRALAADERVRRSHDLCRHVDRSLLRRRARRIACFWPNDGEVDLSPLFARLWQRGATVALPVIAGDTLWFAPFRPDTRVADNRFGIPEPAVRRSRALPLLALDLVLVPLVAFDATGNRIGMGGGFYDRTFAHLRRRRCLRRPRLVGVGFDFQRVTRLPAEPWDVPLDAAVTERGYHRFPSRT